MNRFQAIFDIPQLCFKKGLKHIVLCPGSRCAPLTLAFTRHPKLIARTFSDERSAGFIALGMAEQTKSSTVLICTSGTAAYNFSPAVAEAFFNQIPLLVFTADRPAEWIAQHDGQTIYQSEIFGKHVKGFFELPQEYEHSDSQWAINRVVNEAINLSMQEPYGPVHINAPFREPLYPSAGDDVKAGEDIRVIEEVNSNFPLSEGAKQKITEQFSNYNHILVVSGQYDHDDLTIKTLEKFTNVHSVPVAGDIISNLHSIDRSIKHSDLFLGQANDQIKKTLRPDLLITFGRSVISKNLKLYLRKYSPAAHWHIQPSGAVADPFQSVTEIFRASPASFFSFANVLNRKDDFRNQKQVNYRQLWEVEERKAVRTLHEFFPQEEFGELELVNEVLKNLPSDSNLHLANSMSVRYANFIGLEAKQNGISVYANRGTSGIDGCSSTVVGHCLSTDRPNVLITGDIAFFYDRNAFWHNYDVPNLRIVVLNNHGGIIFKMIDGPGTVPESDEYFVTRQNLNASYLCQEFGFNHLKLDNKRKMKNLIKDFFDFDGKTKILELESDSTLNKTVFENFKQKIKNSYEA
jgi:2-succinyl-5-enolpyruvyl-6-hydroxy-3-cyclohexene-1-carboxylate synthase